MNLCKTCGTICPFDDERTECDAYAPMTNENWLRSCTTEQLAECIIGIDYGDDKDIKFAKLLEWLKQPHTNE